MLKEMLLKIENDYLIAKINTHGAELSSLVLKESGREYIWYGKKDIWGGHSPILFPIVGMLKDGKYFLDNKEYFLNKHGFARNSDFEYEKTDENCVLFTLKDSEETLKSYPYRFILTVKFQLEGKKLSVSHFVKNCNEAEMYFSLGAHPAFNAQIGSKIIFDESENLRSIGIDEQGMITSENCFVVDESRQIVITDDIFNKDALIFEGVRSEGAYLEENGKKLLHFNWGNAPYLGLWAKPGAEYVCIEPWFGVNDGYDSDGNFKNKKGICALEKDEVFSYTWTAEIV